MLRTALGRGLARSSLSMTSSMAQRALATKVVTHCVGPDRVGVMKEVAMTVLGLGGKISDARAVTLDGTFSVTATVSLPDDSCNVAWALQTKMPDYLVVVRPESSYGAAGSVFGRLEIVGASSAGAIAQFTENMAARGISFATFRVSDSTTEGSTKGDFNATATLQSSAPVDIDWLNGEFADLGEKLDLDIKFEASK